jgi:hypothetical protein
MISDLDRTFTGPAAVTFSHRVEGSGRSALTTNDLKRWPKFRRDRLVPANVVHTLPPCEMVARAR